MKIVIISALLGLVLAVVAACALLGGYGLMLSAVVVAGFLSWCSDPEGLSE